MDQDLADMLRISNSVGRNERLVQGGGGNASVKTPDGQRMYVKASGTGLSEMRDGRGYRQVDVRKCLATGVDESLLSLTPAEREARVLEGLCSSCVDQLEGRPSVETSLHAMLGRCVVHTHPSVVNGMLCATKGKQKLAELFGYLAPPYLYVQYVDPGYMLATQLNRALADYRKQYDRLPEVIFLENHGLFVTTDSADRVLSLTREVFDAIERSAAEARGKAGHPPFCPMPPEQEKAAVAEVAAGMRRFYAGIFGRPALVRFDNDQAVTGLLSIGPAEYLSSVPPVFPDQVVYCADRPIWLELPEDLTATQQRVTEAITNAEAGVDTPLCVLVKGLGLFTAAPSPKMLEAAASVMRAVLETLSVAFHFGGPRGLSSDALDFLRGWEVERFRRGLAAGEGARNDLAGKVAVVTGAGSGLGRGISLGLARKGVHVVLADIDVESAQETARRIKEQEAPGRGYPAWADVTSEEHVGELINYLIRELGGVDILVNCAGIAPVHSLVDFPLDAWQKTLDVNLTGYFLVAREVARCMVRQGTGGNIINISSKTGLEASRHHSAYNATKAAEIHVARGWALDLAEYGIRVNIICPGNVFTESKIWNEEYIKALAKKRGLEPEEVIPYYIGLTALKQEITWDDIAEAVAFLASDAASKITGQSLVVDGGQVFVR